MGAWGDGRNMAKKPGEMTVSEVAKELGATKKTIRKHAKNAVVGEEPTRFHKGAVRVDWCGRYYIRKSEVLRQIGSVS